jgi:hypothetical protein
MSSDDARGCNALDEFEPVTTTPGRATPPSGRDGHLLRPPVPRGQARAAGLGSEPPDGRSANGGWSLLVEGNYRGLHCAQPPGAAASLAAATATPGHSIATSTAPGSARLRLARPPLDNTTRAAEQMGHEPIADLLTGTPRRELQARHCRRRGNCPSGSDNDMLRPDHVEVDFDQRLRRLCRLVVGDELPSYGHRVRVVDPHGSVPFLLPSIAPRRGSRPSSDKRQRACCGPHSRNAGPRG